MSNKKKPDPWSWLKRPPACALALSEAVMHAANRVVNRGRFRDFFLEVWMCLFMVVPHFRFGTAQVRFGKAGIDKHIAFTIFSKQQICSIWSLR